jgi:5-formyltetrahydrofolate cyclo-ligase
VARIAIAFDLQVLPQELPVGSFDLGVDVIVTETETIRCAPGGNRLPSSQT